MKIECGLGALCKTKQHCTRGEETEVIKLSLFMLDPVKAHEKYRKEVEELKEEIKKKEASHKELKLQYNLLKKKIKNQKGTLNVLENKIREERMKNEIW